MSNQAVVYIATFISIFSAQKFLQIIYVIFSYDIFMKLKECFFFGHEWFCHILQWVFKNAPGSLCVDSKGDRISLLEEVLSDASDDSI